MKLDVGQWLFEKQRPLIYYWPLLNYWNWTRNINENISTDLAVLDHIWGRSSRFHGFRNIKTKNFQILPLKAALVRTPDASLVSQSTRAFLFRVSMTQDVKQMSLHSSNSLQLTGILFLSQVESVPSCPSSLVILCLFQLLTPVFLLQSWPSSVVQSLQCYLLASVVRSSFLSEVCGFYRETETEKPHSFVWEVKL